MMHPLLSLLRRSSRCRHRFPVAANLRQQEVWRKQRYLCSFLDDDSGWTTEDEDDYIDESSLVTVALLGPTNAGKSTLFNRLLDKQANKAYRLATEKNRRKQSRKFSGRLTANNHATSRRGGTAAKAIVSAVPGTTRDRRECWGRIGGTTFRLVDTAGVDGERILQTAAAEDRPPTTLLGEPIHAMMQQTIVASQQAELILLMLDAKVGVTVDLMETVRWLRKNGAGNFETGVPGSNDDDNVQKRIVVLANKLEGVHWNYDGSPVLENLDEVTRLGFGEALPISALHGEGMADIAVVIERMARAKKKQHLLLEQDESSEDDENETIEDEKPLQLAIVGRVNVGKSTLVNSLLQQERVIVGATPGLTRDAIRVEWSWQGRPIQLVDTAGIRKPAQRQQQDEIEELAVQDAMRALKTADVAVLVLDAQARMLQRQELAIANAVLREGRALVVAANKMDLIVERGYSKDDFAQGVRNQLEGRFPMLRQTPIVPMCSLTGECVEDLLPVVFRARDRWARKIPTAQLNRWIKEVMDTRKPPPVSGKQVRIKYLLQTKGRPPTFLLFCNSPTGQLAESYLRFLMRHFQDTFEMYGMQVRMAVKQTTDSNPYDKQKKRGGSGIGGRKARKQRNIQSLKTTGMPHNKRRRRRSSSQRYR